MANVVLIPLGARIAGPQPPLGLSRLMTGFSGYAGAPERLVKHSLISNPCLLSASTLPRLFPRRIRYENYTALT